VGGEVTFVAIFRDSLFFTCLNKKEKVGWIPKVTIKRSDIQFVGPVLSPEERQ
jgi:hypothetical protein